MSSRPMTVDDLESWVLSGAQWRVLDEFRIRYRGALAKLLRDG